MTDKTSLPLYAEKIYGWLYNHPERCAWFEKGWVQRLLTFGCNRRLRESLLREIEAHGKVLQMGVTFGEEISDVAARVGNYGQFDIMDVNPLQLTLCRQKYGRRFPTVNFIEHDAAELFQSGGYDVVICYNLLHEVPIVTKSKIVNNALLNVKDGGKVVFIDYHNPKYLHPLRYFVRMFNRLYQPFAEKLWDREIHSYAENKTAFSWRKSTYFGRMYQKVVAVKKITPLN